MSDEPSKKDKNPSEAATVRPKKTTKKPASGPNGPVIWVVALFLGISGGYIGGYVQEQDSSNETSADQGQQVILNESELIAGIAEDVGQSVVSISVESVETGFFGREFAAESAGTGIILSEDGYIVTNKHVIPESATSVNITTSEGVEYEGAQVVGRDPFTDIAFLKVDNPENFVAAKIGDSDQVKVGDRVVAIGNALGEFSNTVTSGIVSGLSRPLFAGDSFGGNNDSLQNLFQTDASINPGNSGGPLVNVNGEVIGINTAVAGNAENIGFSIPVNDISGAIASVLEDGELVKPYLGVRYINLNEEIAESLNLDISEGALLDSSVDTGASIAPDSPADKAGLIEGDIITAVNGDQVTGDAGLASFVGRFKVGDVIKLSVYRGGETIELEATLERVPDSFN